MAPLGALALLCSLYVEMASAIRHSEEKSAAHLHEDVKEKQGLTLTKQCCYSERDDVNFCSYDDCFVPFKKDMSCPKDCCTKGTNCPKRGEKKRHCCWNAVEGKNTCFKDHCAAEADPDYVCPSECKKECCWSPEHQENLCFEEYCKFPPKLNVGYRGSCPDECNDV
ncbi:unnamed protein product [Symbiodinium pilosum]|uniref:Uncharacterized protein n=1 Tax=Symbiodinium pilosum TaxID=2952 RepID=A0A812J9U4_SYMPI|nr:unnamed protein product [Symbiodinium pilosum]